MRLLRAKRSHFNLLNQIRLKSIAHDAPKPAITPAAAEPSSSTFPISEKLEKTKVTLPSDPPVTVNIGKPNLDLLMAETAAIKTPYMTTEERTRATSFDKIPGPISLRIINKIWSLVPVISKTITAGAVQYVLSVGSLLSWSGNVPLFKRFFAHYGPVVRLFGPLGGDIVMVSRPEHVEAVFQSEGPYPIRSSLDSVEKYRLQYRKLKHSGPFLMFGPEWEVFRKSVEQPLPLLMSQQYGKIDDTCDKFVARIANIRNRQEEVPGTFQQEILKWSLECMCLVTIDRRLGFLDPCGLSSTSDPGILLESLIGATKAIQRCEYGLHLWQFFETPAWKSLVQNCDSIDLVLSKYVSRIQRVIHDKKEKGDMAGQQKSPTSIMENVLLKPGIMLEDSMTILLDMMLIGVNATTHTVAFLLYHLAKNPKCQVKLFEEIQRQPQQLSRDTLASMPYLQACIKESLRLKPPIPLIGRILQNDITIYNYHIPRGTYLLMVTHLSGWRDEYFEDAEKFKPERWLNPIEGMQIFASLPYGYGAKGCLGKDLAEMQIGTLITKIMRKFRIDYLYADINSTNKLLAEPDRKLRFRFAERVVK